jgi:hypothetical protein
LHSIPCPDADYTFKYSNDLEALDVGDKCSVLMFDVLPGKSKQFMERQLGCKPTAVSSVPCNWY